MRSLHAIYQDSLRILYAFLLPTVKEEALEMAIVALGLIELMYAIDIALLLQLCGIDLLGSAYRLKLTVAAMVLALANFMYFYPRRSLVREPGNLSPAYRAVLTLLLVLPAPLLLAVFVLYL